MKTTFLTFAFLLTFSFASADIVVDGKNINDSKDIQVCIVAVGDIWYHIELPGRQKKHKEYKNQVVTDENGNELKDINLLSVINWMEFNGWEYMFNTTPTSATPYILFRKKE